MASCKIYGLNLAVFGKSFKIAGLIDRHLEIYGTQTKFKIVVFRSTTKGWRKKENILEYREIKKPTTKQDVEKVINELGFTKDNLLWKHRDFDF